MKKTNDTDEEPLRIIIDKHTYDVTKYQYEHPGGRLPLQLLKDKNCTVEFHAVGHSKFALKLLQKYRVSSSGTGETQQTMAQTREYKAQECQKFFVFILSMIATSTTIYSYWNLICNNHDDDAPTIETFEGLIHKIITSIYFPTQALLGSYLLADYLLVEECCTNFERLQLAGFPFPYVIFSMSLIYIFSAPILGVIFWMLLQDSQPYISSFMVAKIIIIYVCSDLPFECVHKWMHYSKPEWHLMHHVAIFPTACSGLIFDFPDYALEFWAAKFPIIFILGTDMLNMYDGFACVLCLSMAILIDICNHDAWCRTPHFYHHVSTASTYGIMPFEIRRSYRKEKAVWDHLLRHVLESALLGNMTCGEKGEGN